MDISKTFSDEGLIPACFEGLQRINTDAELGKETVEHREKGKDIKDACYWSVKALRGED